MAINISEYLKAPIVGTYITNNPNVRQPYFGEGKFPDRKKIGLDLAWIKGANKAPVALQPSAFDADVIPLMRDTINISQTRMPFFKNSYQLDEKQRQDLLSLSENAPQAVLDVMLGNIYADAAHLVDSAALAREAMRMQALTTGVIALSDNGQTFTYDYGLSDEQKVTPSTLWSDTSADPVADIETWQNAIEAETGVRPTEMLINSTTLGYIAKTDAVKNAIYVFANGTVRPTRNQVKSFLLEQNGVTVYVYDKGYKIGDTFTNFIPDGTVVLMPDTDLGSTWFGTTPEEAEFLAGMSDVSTYIVDTGVALTSYRQPDPVAFTIKASQVCLPSFEAADEIVIASVL